MKLLKTNNTDIVNKVFSRSVWFKKKPSELIPNRTRTAKFLAKVIGFRR